MPRRALQNWRLRAGLIIRVIHVGDEHVCGICRTRFTQGSAAILCLESCWHELLHLDPIIHMTEGGHRTFKCRYCARKHEAHADALRCAKDCRDHFIAKHDAELSAKGNTRTKRPKRKRMVEVPAPHPIVQNLPLEKEPITANDLDDADLKEFDKEFYSDEVEESIQEEAPMPVAQVVEDWATEEGDNELEEIVTAI